jgi:hypothetical protein
VLGWMPGGAPLFGARRLAHRTDREGQRAAGDEGGHDVGGVSVEGLTTAVKRMVVRGSAWLAASCTSRSGTPASRAAMRKAWRRVCGPTRLVMPARRATRDPPSCVTVESLACRVDEDRTVEGFSDGQVDGASDPRREWHHGDLAALADPGQGAMATLQTERVGGRRHHPMSTRWMSNRRLSSCQRPLDPASTAIGSAGPVGNW